MSNRTYDLLRKLIQIGLPALASFFFGLAELWDIPDADKIVGTIALITTFAGVLLQISANRYWASDRPYDGTMVITRDADQKRTVGMEFDAAPEDVINQHRITFRTREGTPEELPRYDELAKAAQDE